jgi:hypothetical protein
MVYVRDIFPFTFSLSQLPLNPTHTQYAPCEWGRSLANLALYAAGLFGANVCERSNTSGALLFASSHLL